MAEIQATNKIFSQLKVSCDDMARILSLQSGMIKFHLVALVALSMAMLTRSSVILQDAVHSGNLDSAESLLSKLKVSFNRHSCEIVK